MVSNIKIQSLLVSVAALIGGLLLVTDAQAATPSDSCFNSRRCFYEQLTQLGSATKRCNYHCPTVISWQPADKCNFVRGYNYYSPAGFCE